MKLLLTGVTGAAGAQIYRSAIADPSVESITVISRRPLPSTSPTSPKSTTIVVSDFLSYPPSLLPTLSEHDACIWALGTSSTGHSEESYTKITYDYLVKAVEAIKEGRKQTGNENMFQFVYLSAEGADQSEKSLQMFGRVKGRAEKYLLDLPSSSHIRCSILRPGYFFPAKEDAHIRSSTSQFIDKIATPVISNLAPSVYTPVEGLGKVAVELSKGRWDEEKDRVFKNVRIRDMLRGFKEREACCNKDGSEAQARKAES